MTFDELLYLQRKCGYRVGLELRGATSKSSDGAYVRVVNIRRGLDRELVVTVVEDGPGESLDAIASRIARELSRHLSL